MDQSSAKIKLINCFRWNELILYGMIAKQLIQIFFGLRTCFKKFVKFLKADKREMKYLLIMLVITQKYMLMRITYQQFCRRIIIKQKSRMGQPYSTEY